jgi:ProP effector
MARQAQCGPSLLESSAMSETTLPPAAPAEPAAPGAPAAPAAPSPADCAQQLRQLFPALFSGAAKPLKLRIQIDIQERAPGQFTKQALSAFFRRHTGSTSYLIAVSKAAHRFDLDGQPSGEVSAEHRQAALDELARRRANQQSRIELEEQQRRNRAALLHDFQTTTLTPANFCALKGVAVDELEGLLAIARTEADERARQAQPGRAPGFDRPRRPGPPGDGQRPRNPR